MPLEPEVASVEGTSKDDVIYATENTAPQNVSVIAGNGGADVIIRDRTGNYNASGESFGNVHVYDAGHNTVDNDTDIISYQLSESGVVANLENGIALTNSPYQLLSHGFDYLNGFDGVVGTHHQDYLIGNTDGNLLNGLGGNDLIWGDEGNDTINSGAHADTVHGGEGNDSINAGGGSDIVSGDEGADTVNGGSGHDTIEGGSGNDAINGGSGNDEISGGSGNDYVNGGSGNDTIDAGFGNDAVLGGLGDDDISGGLGHDTIDGGDGDDTIDGGSKNDVIRTGDGDDDVFGGTGRDTIIINGDGVSNIDGGAGIDVLKFEVEGNQYVDLDNGIETHNTSWSYLSNIENVRTGNGDDVINGSSGSNHIVAGGGNDMVFAVGGDDTIYAGKGDDTVVGADGDDTIIASAGNDSIEGRGGDDYVNGGAGSDVIQGGQGADVMRGGWSSDTFRWVDGDVQSGSDLDVIKDFKVNTDKLAFDDDFFDFGPADELGIHEVLFGWGVNGDTYLNARTAEAGWVSIAVLENTNSTLLNQKIANGTIFDVELSDVGSSGPDGFEGSTIDQEIGLGIWLDMLA